jgi:hypothetical protein
MSKSHPSPGEVEKAEEKARQRDPHGTAPAEGSAQPDPSGAPSADRSETETAATEKVQRNGPPKR